MAGGHYEVYRHDDQESEAPGEEVLPEGGSGFAICVYPSGVKSWYFIYTIDGARRYIALGNYPAVSLGDAKASTISCGRCGREGRTLGKNRPARSRRRSGIWRRNTLSSH
ncbi:Arm DNA-binding domain-containing protein [Geomonas silvestris]|uniref:Arm DNA-binding domain-containing protein n=1 Tax=Geomonas silvestris TaxID=2740184 RepID=UPI00161479D2